MILLTWLSLNKLKLNCDKTELLVIGLQHSPVSQLFSFTAVDGSVINPTNSASNISVIFDNNLNMERQVAVICNSTFFTFAIFLVLGSSCQLKAPKFLAHAFVMCRLDNCNSLLYGLPKYFIHRLQLVQNCAVRQIPCGSK